MDICIKFLFGVFVYFNFFFIILQYSINVFIFCYVVLNWILVGVKYLFDKGFLCNVQILEELFFLLMSFVFDNSDLFILFLKYGVNFNIYYFLVNGNVIILMVIERDVKMLLIVILEIGVKQEIFGKYFCKFILCKVDLVSCIRDIDKD